MNEQLDALRPRMMSVAYRMLGSVADAEDAVQDAFLRLHATDDVVSPEGFLITATTRRCIDQLRVRSRTEYIGSWVPEPVDTHAAAGDASLGESLTQAFLLLLERLTPDERAAFLLRTVFDYEYAEIGAIVDKSEASVRQLVSRARRRLGLAERRFSVDAAQADALAERFVAACRIGDVAALERMLTADAELLSDGGGKVFAARVAIRGPQRVAKFLTSVFRKNRHYEVRPTTVNRRPGLVMFNQGKLVQVVSFDIDEQVRGIFFTRNPDKLARWSIAVVS
jgi:RNA polymerase sigma-70 factor (ECF subfamily)